MNRTVAVIPARYGSSRLPAKALADIAGQPMIVRVARRAALCSKIQEIFVATDHHDIKEAAEEAGFQAVMTSPDHTSGTDRIAEACSILGLSDQTLVVNIQGDQPLVEPSAIEAMIQLMESDSGLDMATVACPMKPEEIDNPNRVKVVVDGRGRALYFSRAAIPFDRDGDHGPDIYLRHLGLYTYRRSFLRRFTSLAPARLETIEKLEQLRALENGYSIGVAVVASAPPEVDTEEDLRQVKAIVSREASG